MIYQIERVLKEERRKYLGIPDFFEFRRMAMRRAQRAGIACEMLIPIRFVFDGERVQKWIDILFRLENKQIALVFGGRSLTELAVAKLQAFNPSDRHLSRLVYLLNPHDDRYPFQWIDPPTFTAW